MLRKVTGVSSGASLRRVTPEDIEQLKQLKQLLDDGVLTAEEFALQKSLILAPPQNPELVNSESQSKQVDGSSTKEQNSRRVEGTQGASTTRPVSDVDPIREMHIKMNLPKPVTKTATSTSKRVTSNTKKLVLTFSAIILVALVVLVSVIAGGSNDSSKEGDTDSSMVVSTGNDADVDMGQVWNWYDLMKRCAIDVWNKSTNRVGRDFDQEEFYNVMPLLSYMAGTSRRVAELIEKGDWPSEVQEEMAKLAALQRQYADLIHTGSRKSFDEWNTYNDTWTDFDYGVKYDALEVSIHSKIGVPWLDSGEPGSLCDSLDYYEANPPDFSIFPTEGGLSDGLMGLGLREVCGVVRDLEVPNGNNPDSHLAYINNHAQSLWDFIQADELDGPSESKYAELAKWLVQTIDVFMQRNSPAMPLSHMYVVEGCERFGW